MAFSDGSPASSTGITDTLGWIFQRLVAGDPIGVNICFQAIAFVGLVRLLLSVEPEFRRQFAIFVMLPSFTLWSSIASKESIVVFSICFISSYLIKAYRNEYRFHIFHIFPVYLLFIFKPHYFASIVFFLVVLILTRHVRQKALLAAVLGVFSLTFLWIFRDTIDTLAFVVQIHFVGEGAVGRSSRPEYWEMTYDVYRKAPSGMVLAFFGPTWREASTSLVHILSFAESCILSVVLIGLFLRRLPELPVYSVFITSLTSFWLMFANYPFGVMNPGTAIRYRTGYVILIFVMFSIVLSRRSYLTWTGARKGLRN